VNRLKILLPLYNDWRSCNLLLKKINNQLKKRNRMAAIIILDDASTQKTNLSLNNLKNVKSIDILKMKENLGSQKIISIGLNYLRNKKNEIITIMDSDGEDDVTQINNLIDVAEKNKKYVIVASRTRRKESLIFRFLYKVHLLITFFLTFKWISFGNYSSFHSSNIKKILKNKYSWLAYSSCISKNCKIKKVRSSRQKRFFGKSKLSFLGLFNHSLRVISVYQKKIFFVSSIYLMIIFTLRTYINYFEIIICCIIFFNFLIHLIKRRNLQNYNDKYNFIQKRLKIK